MKTLRELYVETIGNEGMTREFLAASEAGSEKLAAFLKNHGCDASLEELDSFLAGMEEESELGQEELEMLAGGSKKGAKKFFKGAYDNTVGGIVDGAVDIVNDGKEVVNNMIRDFKKNEW